MPQLSYDTLVKQEEERLTRQYPNAEDIPGCLNLFETWTGCNGMIPLVCLRRPQN